MRSLLLPQYLGLKFLSRTVDLRLSLLSTWLLRPRFLEIDIADGLKALLIRWHLLLRFLGVTIRSLLMGWHHRLRFL